MCITVRWLLQGGLLFDISSVRVVIDPYISDIVERKQGLTRLATSPLKLEELKPDCWVCTHDHLDHLDPESVREASVVYPDCRFIGPDSVCRHLAALGVKRGRIIPFNEGHVIRIADDAIELRATKADHSDHDAVGVVMICRDTRIYISGDTMLLNDLEQFAQSLGNIDLMFVCINGKCGNMSWQSAIKLAEVIKPKMAIPMHYGLFAENTVDPTDFVRTCHEKQIDSFAMLPGVSFQI